MKKASLWGNAYEENNSERELENMNVSCNPVSSGDIVPDLKALLQKGTIV